MMMMGNSSIFFILFLFLSSQEIICKASEHGKPKFTYKNGTHNGPENWSNIHSTFSECNTGKLQSPIALDDTKVEVTHQLGPLIQSYKPAHAVLTNQGHAIQITWTQDAGKIVINGTYYKLEQCHWHTPSENTVNGKRYDMELHLVHKNAQNDLAAVGILYKIGRPDPFLKELISHIKTAGNKGKDLGIINPRKIRHGTNKYYLFIGSITTPPCSQGVLWTVISKVNTVSEEQIKALKDAVDDGFEENSRPVQPLHGRTVYLNQPYVVA